MKKVLYAFALMLFVSASSVQAQEHVVKLRPFNLLGKKLTVSYEQMITERSSFMVEGGLKLNSGFTMYESQLDTDDVSMGGDAYKQRGARIAAEYRFYPGASFSPDGFYFGPYLNANHSSLSIENAEISANGNTIIADGTGGFTHFGAGIQLGYQWVFGNGFTLDWTILGLGINQYRLDMSMTPQNPGEDWATVISDIDQAYQDHPVLGAHSNIYTEGEDLKADFGFPFLHLRSAIRIGYAF
ncbi:DUF3575 domain-containing protein [Pontibacter sp. G13]|uniref:DUF3575 domain-containing protein n=1 Tax=Pontibacter sp. G13 TaxID=3074898 RepID=UPI00288BAD6C|nr:DUF3575 domain-containing protein [Pontibacter sp. G13]WNJ19441.1 DUF3575 domain-containing protein [Pontibacter sp. G13]